MLEQQVMWQELLGLQQGSVCNSVPSLISSRKFDSLSKEGWTTALGSLLQQLSGVPCSLSPCFGCLGLVT